MIRSNEAALFPRTRRSWQATRLPGLGMRDSVPPKTLISKVRTLQELAGNQIAELDDGVLASLRRVRDQELSA